MGKFTVGVGETRELRGAGKGDFFLPSSVLLTFLNTNLASEFIVVYKIKLAYSNVYVLPRNLY